GAVEQGHLAEEPAGDDRADLVAVDERGRLTLDDDEELIALLALHRHGVTGRVLPRPGQRADATELVVGAAREQPHRPEQLDALVDRRVEAHRTILAGLRRRREPTAPDRRRRRAPTTKTSPAATIVTPTITVVRVSLAAPVNARASTLIWTLSSHWA